ncbi:MAG: methyltransferase domain-containing protein [Cyanobacteria bacterium P01_H01_bin.153]
MNRQQKILKHINKVGHGIEIGPSHNPVASKGVGYNVHIIDHMSREELVKKYTGHGVDLSKIEEVDFVWEGQTYAQLLGKTQYYDWIIASHVIEHTPDLIGFLNDCAEVLNDKGVISLVVPDKRYCFDHFRPITSLAQLIDSHFQRAKIHSAGTVAEYMLNVVARSGAIAWSAHDSGLYSFVHSLNDAQNGIKSVTEQQRYLDVHAWCFVPHSFRLLMHDLFELGLISVKEVDFYQTEGFEFYITLGRQGRGIDRSRMEMLEIIDAEIKAGMDERSPTFKQRSAGLFQATKRIIKAFLRQIKHFIKQKI